MVQLLLSLGASLSLTDDDGDTALHYSAFGLVALYFPLVPSQIAQKLSHDSFQ